MTDRLKETAVVRSWMIHVMCLWLMCAKGTRSLILKGVSGMMCGCDVGTAEVAGLRSHAHKS